MISFPEARSRILQHCAPLGTEEVDLSGLTGRVLAEDLVAPFDVPHFDNSAVDGYALQTEDAGPRTIVGTSAAGAGWEGSLSEGQAVRIFTGAPIPRGADAVVMQEDTAAEGETLSLLTTLAKGENVRRRGEEIAVGGTFPLSGVLASPPIVGLAASFGQTRFSVLLQPRVAILATGDELVMPGETLRSGQVYASNLFALRAAIKSLGLNATIHLVHDDPEATRQTLQKALVEADVVLTIGGVSVGDRDLVRPALIALGVEEIFWRVAIKPGKPFYFGQREAVRVFGLPGNPVSALVTFYALVRPALRKMLGLRTPEEEFTVTLGTPIGRKGTRYEFVRAVLENGTAIPVTNQGSHMQTGLAFANALLHLPDGITSLPAGSRVMATPLRWGLGLTS